MIGDAHRVPVESLDRAGMEIRGADLVSSISCTPRRRARAYDERCETSFGDYTLTDRRGQALGDFGSRILKPVIDLWLATNV
jgi:hypothetical protein